MSMIEVIGLVLVWLVSIYVAGGISVAWSQNTYTYIAKQSYRGDVAFGVFIGLLGGPLSVIVLFFLTGFAEHGLSWNRGTK